MKQKKADDNYFFTKNYFDNLYNKIHSHLILYLIYSDNKLCGGLLALKYKSYINVHLSANNEDGLKINSGYLLRNEIIKDYVESKFLINFGGGLSNSDEDNLLKFKMQFSKNLEDYYMGKVIINTNKYNELLLITENKIINKYNNYFLRYKYI